MQEETSWGREKYRKGSMFGKTQTRGMLKNKPEPATLCRREYIDMRRRSI